MHCLAVILLLLIHSNEEFSETVTLSAETVNQTSEKIGPECFDLLKVLGRGGYGKVSSMEELG